MDSIIFDVDGTLWDSTMVVAGAWTSFLAAEGIDADITAARLKKLFGQLLPDIARQILPSFPQEEQMRLIEGCCGAEHEALLKTPAPLYEGMEETLRALADRIPLFIVSNCQAGYIEVFLEATGLGSLFKDHMCPGDTGLAKAGNISRIVAKHNLASPCYVGDTMGDYEACRQAGVPFIHAAYGFGTVPDAGLRIEKPSDLIPLITGAGKN